jgi:hypothetical protein
MFRLLCSPCRIKVKYAISCFKNFLLSLSFRHCIHGRGKGFLSVEPTQPPVPRSVSPGVKRTGHGSDHSPTLNVELMNVELNFHSPIHLHDGA